MTKTMYYFACPDVNWSDVVWDNSVKQSYDSVHSRAKVFVIVSIAKLFTRYALKLRCEDMLLRAKNVRFLFSRVLYS